MVLHELRNPLAAIDAAARVLADELGSHPARARASAIASEARHLLDVLESVATAEAAAAGRLRSTLVPIDLAALVRDTVAAFPAEGREIGIAGADAPARVNADARRIRQVLANLLRNAVQYSPQGTPVEVSLSREGGSARVSVRDRGPGIPEPERPRLFGRFTRLSTADGTPGSGLGLYICRAIVEDHRGEIGYRDGAFTFALPLAER